MNMPGVKWQVSGIRMRSKSPALIGEDEGVAGEIGVERLLTIEGCEHVALPDEQIGIVRGEFFPGLGGSEAGDALANQDEVGPGDGLMIELRLPLCCSETLQGGAKSGDCFEKGKVRDVGESDADVIGVVKAGGSVALFEILDQAPIELTMDGVRA